MQCNLIGYSATCYSSTTINLDIERVRFAVADEGLHMTPHFRGYRVENSLQARRHSRKVTLQSRWYEQFKFIKF